MQWDGLCASQAVNDCGWTEDCATTCGDAVCELGEACADCPEDCGVCPECGDGECNGEETCADCAVDCGDCAGDCCDSNGSAGCEDGACQDAVCASDAFCCENTWDTYCADCAHGLPGYQGIDCTGNEEACGCEVACGDGLCDDTVGEDCGSCEADCGACPVCGDGECNGDEDCGTCEEDCGACKGDCCVDTGSAGCDDQACEDTVCFLDSYCCEFTWDDDCANCAASGEGFGGLDCSGVGDACACVLPCGDGVCDDDSEDCASCEADCGACEVCGDGACSGDENCLSCDADCGACPPLCGDGECNGDESCDTCAIDCGDCPDTCGDFVCDAGEDCINCPSDCECKMSCCLDNPTAGCNEPDCEAAVCSLDDYCCDVTWDGDCADCAAGGETWDGEDCSGVVADCAVCNSCGDGVCDLVNGEECVGCSEDCGACPTCGDGVCDDTIGEDCHTCDLDCGACPGSCCEAADGTAGCDDATCEAAVCAMDDYCCNTEWDDDCVDCASGGSTWMGDECSAVLADCPQCDPCGDGVCDTEGGEDCDTCELDCGACPYCGDGECNGGEDCDTCDVDCGACKGDCCVENGSAGCDDVACQAEVCAIDSFCCENTWDGYCVDCASGQDGYQGLDCAGVDATCGCEVPVCGDGLCDDTIGEDCDTCPDDCGSCPEPCGDGVCDDTIGEDCDTCDADCGACPFCGDGSCDEHEGCSTCSDDCGECLGGCCESNGTPGCDDGACQASVCALDDFCCETFWDSNCANCASGQDGFGGLDCGAVLADCPQCDPCGDGVCDDSIGEDCGTCEGDCGACPFCGDGECNGDEDCASCEGDCGICKGDCCESNSSAGCDDGACEAAVCEVDGYCCDNTWDSHCANCAAGLPGYGGLDCTAIVAACPLCDNCGDGVCDGDIGEDCLTCGADCGACPDFCGDGECNGDEDCTSCEGDCGACPDPCGDGVCDDAIGEDCASCAGDCGNCAGAGDCCASNGSTGCDDDACEDYVCSQDAWCCDTEWDSICAGEAVDWCTTCGGTYCGDAECAGDEDCTTCAGDCGACDGEGDCCTGNGSWGCDDDDCETYVCSQDAYCCDNTWDDICGNEATDWCGVCGGSYCGDGACGAAEDCSTCDADCGACPTGECGDGVCNDGGEANEYTVSVEGFAFGPDELTIQAGDTVTWTNNDGPTHTTTSDDELWHGVMNSGESFSWTFDQPGAYAYHCTPHPFMTGTIYVLEGVANEGCASCEADCGPCPPGAGDCCTANGSTGCDDDGCETYVCGEDAYCCDTEWDSICAGEAVDWCTGCGGTYCGDGECAGDEDCATCAGDCGACDGEGDCCAANGSWGCEDDPCETYVCGEDAYCCDNTWDGLCAAEATDSCGVCGGSYCGDGVCGAAEDCGGCEADCGECVVTCGDGVCDASIGEDCVSCAGDCGACPGEGDCCANNGSTGCDDDACEDYVCSQDAWCCDNTWDDICAGEAAAWCTGCGGTYCGDGECAGDEDCGTCAGDCGACDGEGDCCADNGSWGCDDDACEAYICEQDAWCCDTTWDGVCASQASDACTVCGGTYCGDGVCGGVEECGSCEGDCGVCPGFCCTASGGVGCTDTDIESCVCALDSWCCDNTWDGICAGEARDDCGYCTGDCCADNGSTGCDDLNVTECVCELDAWCCDNTWDSLCANQASTDCSACAPDVGDVIVTEIMQNPDELSDSDGEYLELHNPTAGRLDLGGHTLRDDGSNSHLIDMTHLWIEPGDFLLLGASDDIGGVTTDYTYVQSEFQLANSDDEVILENSDGLVIDSVVYDDGATFPDPTGASMSLSPDSLDDVSNDDGLNWCQSSTTFGTSGDFGTPGEANPVCPVCGDGSCGIDEDCSSCEADCGACGGGGDCCTDNGTAGCDDEGCETAVCDLDPYCCNVSWDANCASCAASEPGFGGLDCSSIGASCICAPIE